MSDRTPKIHRCGRDGSGEKTVCNKSITDAMSVHYSYKGVTCSACLNKK